MCNKHSWFQYRKLCKTDANCYRSQIAQRTECTILLSVKIVSSLCPKRNAGRESRPHWINKYPKEIIRNKHTERKNKRWISRELKMCWDKLKTARSQAELNTENDIKTNSQSFSSYPNKKRTRKEEMGSLGVALCQYSALSEGERQRR